jgi:hypothetical protein
MDATIEVRERGTLTLLSVRAKNMASERGIASG